MPTSPAILLATSPDFPPKLRELVPSPRLVRVVGPLPSFSRCVAVVGTRSADPEAVAFARTLGRALAAAGRVVVSGGARGIDRAAHEGALDVGGTTVAVLPSGFAPPYPTPHRALFERIAVEGALLSEEEDGAVPNARRLLRRNAIIAALCDALVVVQAPERSGALSTARAARGLGRPVFAVPHTPWDVRGLGCLALLRAGAQVCASAADVLTVGPAAVPETGSSPDRPEPGEAEEKNDFACLTPDQRRLIGLLRRPTHPDAVARRLGWRPPRILAALLELELAGIVELRTGGRYVVRSARP